jgi:hypothetical protein
MHRQSQGAELKFAILDPLSDQGIGLMRTLRRVPGVTVRPVLGGGRSGIRAAAARLLLGGSLTEEEALQLGFSLVPTTHRTTTMALTMYEQHCARLGLSRTMLEVGDKRKMLALAERIGVPVPARYSVEDLVSGLVTFPVFYKEQHEQGGGRRGVARKAGDIPTNGDDLLIEEFIETPGTYGLGFFAQNGVIHSSVAHFESLSSPSAGGSAVALERFSDPRLEELTSRLVSNLSYSGWGLAEFKRTPNGNDYVLMEINGKLWASSEYSWSVSPELLQACFGLPPLKPHELHRPGLFLHRASVAAIPALAFSWISARPRVFIYPTALAIRLGDSARTGAARLARAWRPSTPYESNCKL